MSRYGGALANVRRPCTVPSVRDFPCTGKWRHPNPDIPFSGQCPAMFDEPLGPQDYFPRKREVVLL